MKERTTFSDTGGAKGFSMVELIVAMTFFLAIIGFVATVLTSIQNQLTAQKPRMETLNNAQTAMDTIVRTVRMAGAKAPNCASSFAVTALAPSASAGNSTYSALRVQSDWNPSDCALNGIDEDVTFSVSGNSLYLDAAKQNPFVDGIGAVRFKFYNSGNLLITDPVTNSAQITFVAVELDTAQINGNSTTIKSGVQIRAR